MTNAQMVGPATTGVVESELGQDIALFHPKTGEVVVLNATASDVWRLSDGEHSLEVIVALLAQAYGEDEGTIRPDVESALSLLRRHGFLPLVEE